MGYYLEVAQNHNKADQLINDHGARRAVASLGSQVSLDDVPEDSHLVCVVQNGFFDAAGVCYDERELEAFTSPSDNRAKDWLYVSKDKCRELCHDYDRLNAELTPA